MKLKKDHCLFYDLLYSTADLKAPDCMVFQGMTIDKLNRLVLINGAQVELAGKEFDLLSFLAAKKGKVFTKKQDEVIILLETGISVLCGLTETDPGLENHMVKVEHQLFLIIQQ